MSIPPINPFAGLAASQHTDEKRQIHNEREQYQDVAKMNSASETDAEAAATAASSDRDADGRQAWSQAEGKEMEEENESQASEDRPRGIDHERGNQLDLDG